MFYCTLLYVRSSIAIILMGKRELVALLNLSSWCLVMVERLFLAVPRGCLRFVIVVFPDHTHLLFLIADCLTLNETISYEEVRKCVYEAKLRKASGIDNTLLYSFKRYVRSSEIDANLYNKATITYKAINGLTAKYITNMLTPNSQVHDRSLDHLWTAH